MIVVERMIQEIHLGKLSELEELDKQYDVIESGLGFPPKRRYWAITSPHNLTTIIIERDWESMAAMEEGYAAVFGNEELQKLHAKGLGIVKSSRVELYTPM